MSRWQLVDPEEALAWTGLGLRDVFAGVSPEGFEATATILHAIYEKENAPPLTHHEAERRLIEAGAMRPVVVGGVDLNSVTTSTGIPLGIVGQPKGSRRILWHELAARYNVILDPKDPHVLLRLHGAIGPSWPLSLQPPPEGSLDAESLTTLVDVLKRWTPGRDCFSYYCMLSVRDQRPLVYRAPLESVLEISTSEEVIGSPQNWWPEDRSWLVYTDCDVNATIVGGPCELIREIHAHPALETLRV